MVRCPLWVACALLVVPAWAGTNQTIVVSAPRLDNLDLMAADVAANVTRIDRETIEQSGASAVPEVLRSEANILIRSVTGTPQDGQVSMRGFGENSQLRTLVLVDGHKINRPDMGGIEWSSVPLANVERIEVIRGGQNVLYGNHALSGVIKITTRRGGDDVLRTGGSIGSFGYLQGQASYSGAAGDFDYMAGADAYQSDGYRTNSESHAATAYGSLGWYLNDTDVLTFRLSGGDRYIQFPGPLTYAQMQRDPTQSSNLGDQFSKDRNILSTLLYEAEREWGAARISSGFSLRDRDAALSGRYSSNRQIGATLGPRLRRGDEDSFLMGGLDFQYDDLAVENYLDPGHGIVRSWAELDRATAAPYLFAQRTLAEKTVINGGLRYEYAGTDNRYVEYDERQLSPTIGPFPNPDYKSPPDVNPTNSYSGVVEKQGWAAELSISRKLGRKLELFAGYDRVYRYPSLDEAAAYQGYPLSDPLNENLDPEQGNNWELGSRFTARDASASLTAFFLTLENEIAYDAVRRLNSNIGATRRAGLEAELDWDREWYGASTRWTFVDARFDGGPNNGNRVPLVPVAYGTTSLWISPVELLRLELQHAYVSEQHYGNDEANAGPRMDAYHLFGLRAAFQAGKHVSLTASVNNLFDETYASTAYSGLYYPGEGRSFRFGLNMEF